MQSELPIQVSDSAESPEDVIVLPEPLISDKVFAPLKRERFQITCVASFVYHLTFNIPRRLLIDYCNKLIPILQYPKDVDTSIEVVGSNYVEVLIHVPEFCHGYPLNDFKDNITRYSHDLTYDTQCKVNRFVNSVYDSIIAMHHVEEAYKESEAK